MVVQHNLTAMNSNRMLGITTGNQAKSTEKLSSGYKINRAADDAAGLTISEKMRKQMRGLDRASTNAQDGVSAVQTAEGALTEVHDMLQRMNELAVQASNGTNSETDRDAIQAEIDQLTTEIDRVSETTKFNETYLLKGNADGATTTKQLNAHDAGLAGKLTDNGATATFTLDKALENGDKITIAGEEYTIGDKATKDNTDGYKHYLNTDDFEKTKLQAGDTVTYYDGNKDVTVTMANKLTYAQTNSATGTEAQYKLTDDKSKFSIVDADGTRHDFSVKATPTTGSPNEVSKASADSLITEALKNGSKVYLTADKDGKELDDIEIVSALETGELDYAKWTKANEDTLGTIKIDGTNVLTDHSGATNTIAKSATLGGVTQTFTPSKPISSKDIAEVIGKLKAGDAIMVNDDGTGNTGKLITIADKTDIDKGEFTVDDALKAINRDDEIDQVMFYVQASNKSGVKALDEKGLTNHTTGTAADWTVDKRVSVIGSPAGDSNEGGKVLSVNEAYTKIAEELQKASSIGTDEGKEASVVNKGDGTFNITKGSAEIKEALSFSLHVGADADMTNKIGVDIESMSAAGLGIKGIKVDGNNVANATYAIDAIADAIQQVSSQRSALGAVQNRLEHTIANLDNVVENTTAAESRIRDTDMAEEMVEYSKNNILAQAGQSMLAQANQSNQGVLSLLG